MTELTQLTIRAQDLVLSKKELLEMLKCSASTLHKVIHRDDFPKPFRVADAINSTALWRLEDVQAWLKKRAENPIY